MKTYNMKEVGRRLGVKEQRIMYLIKSCKIYPKFDYTNQHKKYFFTKKDIVKLLYNLRNPKQKRFNVRTDYPDSLIELFDFD